jgi:hypothetical protein
MSRARVVTLPDKNVDDPATRLIDANAERVVLGQIIGFPDMWTAFREAGLRLDDFARFPHRAVFDAIAAADTDGLAPDVPIVLAKLRDVGQLKEVRASFVTLLPDGVPRPARQNIDAMVGRLRTFSRARAAFYGIQKIGAELVQNPEAINNGLLGRTRELIDQIQDDKAGTSVRVSETLADIAARVGDSTTRDLIVGELLAAGETVMLGGEERSLKTWAVIEFAVALAIGKPAFDHLAVPQPGTSLVVGNEDSPEKYLNRFKAVLAGRKITILPSQVRLIVGRGCSIDDPAWREKLVREVQMEDVRVVFLDPLRSVTACTDQGPSEWRPAGDFLRRLARDTGACVVPVHHLTKPAATGIDSRRRTHRISGGGIVATIDCPIVVERVSDSATLLLPDSFKHGPTPASMHVRLITEGPCVRLVGDVITATAGTNLALQAAIVDFVRTHGGAAGSVIAKALRKEKSATLEALRALAEANVLDSATGPHRAILWFVKRPTPASQKGEPQ